MSAAKPTIGFVGLGRMDGNWRLATWTYRRSLPLRANCESYGGVT